MKLVGRRCVLPNRIPFHGATFIYIYIYMIVKEKKHFKNYFGLMLSSVICTKLFLQFFLYSAVNKKEQIKIKHPRQ